MSKDFLEGAEFMLQDLENERKHKKTDGAICDE